jgi:8-oxo-dGTP pyrophosphatase MutT (NUDIX family)
MKKEIQSNIITNKNFNGVAIIITNNKKHLFVKQNKNPFKGYWAPVHGTIKPNELETEAVIREAKEEIGLLVKPIKKLGITTADYKVKQLHWWWAIPRTSTIKIDIKEISAYGYFSLMEALKLPLLPATEKFIYGLMRH